MLVTMLKDEAIRQQAFDVGPELQNLAEREDHDLLLFRVKHFSGHPKPMRSRCWRFNITPSLQCPPEVVYSLIRLVSALDASDAKIKVLPAALNTYRFLDDLQRDWREKTGKTMMPHLEMCNNVNAWDAMMQEAARDYDTLRTLPTVPEARHDHARRVAMLQDGCGHSLKIANRATKEEKDVFDLKCWASEYAQVDFSPTPDKNCGKGPPDWIPCFFST
jgi:hypothetical protein